MDALASYGSGDSEEEVQEESVKIPILSEAEARRREVFARNVPHTVGNWATHVYLDLSYQQEEEREDRDCDDSDNERDEWRQCRQRWAQRLQHHLERLNLPIDALVLHDHWHVSLSKTFYLQNYNIDSFVNALQRALESSSIKSDLIVRVHGNPPVVLSNALDLPEEHTADHKSTKGLYRTFWCAQVQPPLKDLVNVVDGVLSTWKLPLFYDPPLFHTSWASAPGDWTTTAETTPPSLFEEGFIFHIKHVTCRVGNRVFRIPLSKT